MSQVMVRQTFENVEHIFSSKPSSPYILRRPAASSTVTYVHCGRITLSMKSTVVTVFFVVPSAKPVVQYDMIG